MRRSILARFILAIISLQGCLIVPAQKRVPKAIFVIVDGIPADVIEKVHTPTLDSLAKIGGFTKSYVGGEVGGYSQSPTISAVGYNSLLTGTWANKHNVWDNDIDSPNYSYKNIFRLIKEQQPHKKTAVFSSWLDNRTKLVGHGLPDAGRVSVDFHYDGLELDTIQFPHDPEKLYMHLIDEAVINKAAELIQKESPDLTWVYLEYTDDMGHRYGDSDQFYSSVETMDAQISKLANAIAYRQKNHDEDWLIFITTDHGRDAKTGHNHGGQSLRERTTWIVSNSTKLNDYYYTGSAGIVDILPTIAKHLKTTLPVETLRELDGVPLTGKISVINPKVTIDGKKMRINWTALNRNGKAKILISRTNKYASGGVDEYQLIKTAAVSSESVTIDIPGEISEYYKVIIEAPFNTINRWIKTGSAK